MSDNFGSQNPPPGYDPRQERDYRGETGACWRGRYGRSTSSKLIGAIILIGAGTLLFLDNIGLLPIHNVWDYWPIILVAIGVGKISTARYASDRVLGVVLVVFGALLLLVSLHVVAIHSWSNDWPISILLIGLGCAALVKAVESSSGSRAHVGFPRHPPRPKLVNGLHEQAVFGNVQRRLNNELFTGADLHSVFGHIELDLRGARTEPKNGSLIVNIECVFGAIKLRVPQTWRVEAHVEGVFGSFEDKTIPVTATQGFEPTILLLTGSYVFGGIELDN